MSVVSWSDIAVLVPVLASCGEISTMSLPTLKQAAYYAGVDEAKFGVCQYDIETKACAVIVFAAYGGQAHPSLSLPSNWFVYGTSDEHDACYDGRAYPSPIDLSVTGTADWNATAFYPDVIELDIELSGPERDPIRIRGTLTTNAVYCNYGEGAPR